MSIGFESSIQVFRSKTIPFTFPTFSCVTKRQNSSSSWNSFKTAVSKISSLGNGSKKNPNPSTPIDAPPTIESIRTIILDEINHNPHLYHENDVVKVKSSDWFIDRFIKEHETDSTMNVSRYIIECMKWRKDIGINDVKSSDFPKEFYDTELFRIGHLDDGRIMIYLTCHRFRRLDGFTDLWVDFFLHCYESQYDTHKDGTSMVALVDVTGVGLSCVDLPLFFKLMSIVLKYYPSLVSKVYIMDMSWIFKPIAKVIFAALPKKYANMVSFLSRDEFKSKVGTNKVPDFMGGPIDTYRIEPPENCPTLEQVAGDSGITVAQIKKAKKVFNEITRQSNKV